VKKKYECDLGLVGGGTYEKIEKQLGKEFLKEFTFVFAECGSVAYNKERKILLQNNIRKHKLYSNIQKCMKHSLRFISESSYEIGGHFIDIRNGLVYISLVGMDATLEMREHFKKMDQKMSFRKRLLLQLHERCDKGISVVYGGEVGISMYPKEWDKIQVMKWLKDYPIIHFFGDRYQEDGNDYQMIHHPKVIGHKVDHWKETIDFLKGIL
jgi:phosphomannomutase